MHERSYRKYLLSVLLVILASNYVDRFALGLLLQDIKVDLKLSDTQLGMLGGFAFALFYSVIGIPIARWADRGNRVTIITLTTAVWSVAVALCGLVGSFVQLLIVRIAVAAGEAGCIPPGHSLIADYFTRAERPRAVAIYKLGWPLSVVAGYFIAGWLNEFYGWRWTFVMLGLPGLGLAALAWLTLKEPRCESARLSPESIGQSALQRVSVETPTDQPSLREVAMALWGNSTFCHLTLFFSVLHFFGYGIYQWQPAFLMRSYGLQTGELGTYLTAIWGVGGLLGVYCGGELASRFATHNERLQLRVMAMLYSGYGIVSGCIYLSPTFSPSPYLPLGLMAVGVFAVSTVSGPLFAIIQTVVPNRIRAMSVAVIFLFANLIGMGFGPLAAGALSDALRPSFGEESLRYALLIISPGYLWGAWHLWSGSSTVTRDLERLNATGDALDDTNAGDPQLRAG